MSSGTASRRGWRFGRFGVDRFWAKVDKTDGCWLWSAARTADGYGNIKVDGKARRAHRLAYELSVGEIPAGLDLDHLCRNRSCVNPDHLEPVTRRENVLRGDGLAALRAKQTHCKSGHEFTPENTYTGSGGRSCRRCQVAAVSRYRSREETT